MNFLLLLLPLSLHRINELQLRLHKLQNQAENRSKNKKLILDATKRLEVENADLRNRLKQKDSENAEMRQYISTQFALSETSEVEIEHADNEVDIEIPEAGIEDDNRTETETMNFSDDVAYHDEDEEPETVTPVLKGGRKQPASYKFYTDEEDVQTTDYIFNLYQPLPPNRPFGRYYWKALSKRLEDDQVCTRTHISLQNNLRRFRMYEFAKNKQLQTAEHRAIAVMAFESYGGAQRRKLIDEYDRARDASGELIAQSESLIKQAKTIRFTRGNRHKFSPETGISKLLFYLESLLLSMLLI